VEKEVDEADARTLEGSETRQAAEGARRGTAPRRQHPFVGVHAGTYASLLIQNGESLAYVRDQLGHSSIQVTVDVYGDLVPGSNRAAVDRLDDASNSIPAASDASAAAAGNTRK
jgi:integrase